MREPASTALPHVLVVEDNELVSGALKLLLSESGFRVSVAGTVAEAVAVCSRDSPRLMLLDLTLPDGDGLVAVATLRERGAMPPITVALTGHDDPDVTARCTSAGCVTVLVKPVPARELLRRVREWVAEPGV